MRIDSTLTPQALLPLLNRFWNLSAEKIRHLDKRYDRSLGSPVFTKNGLYCSRGWTDWTQGFEFGAHVLQFDATTDISFLDSGRRYITAMMPNHLTHMGVHDHGFNTISTFGNLLRLCHEKRFDCSEWEQRYYELAIRCSAAVQARRWSRTTIGGYIYSFNGPHSLFADTIRTLRVLAVAHQLGHGLFEEGDEQVSLLARLIAHAKTTADYAIYYGEARDSFDVPGRVAHESIFDTNNGRYRCPNSQQGYSPFTTWTRGLAWILCGYTELLEFLNTVPNEDLTMHGGRDNIEQFMLRAARATADFYIKNTCTDGIPMWDTGAPGLHHLDEYQNQRSNPYNDFEPVDSSAAAIAAQGLLRLGKFLSSADQKASIRYRQAGLTVMQTLLSPPYISSANNHEGLLLHSVYHQPNGWDHIPEGRKIPCDESSMWGDYHMRELALYVQRLANNQQYHTFFIQPARK